MTTQLTSTSRRSLGWLLYFLAFLLIAGPISEWVVITLPVQPRVESWRFAAIGLLGDRVMLPSVGIFIAILTATLLEHRGLQRTLAGLAILAVPVLTALAIAIALDGLELRRTVRPDVLWGFDRSLARTVVVLLYTAVFTAVLGRASLKAKVATLKAKVARPAPVPQSSLVQPALGATVLQGRDA